MGHTPADDGREVFEAVLPDPLDGGDFVLRRAGEADIPAIVGLVDDEMRMRLDLPADFDPALARLMALHGGTLLIADPATDLPVGGFRLFLHGDAVEFGYWLGAEARGRGLATRGLLLLLEELTDRLEPSRFELRTTLGNTPSERVAARAGFRLIGPEPPIEYPGGRVALTNLWVRRVEAQR